MHLFVDNLTNVDFSYLDAKRGLVGETWLASIVLEGALDEQGMVLDFGIVKKTLRNWLDDTIDHCLLVPVQASQLKHDVSDETVQLSWQFDSDKQITTTAPQTAITFIKGESITPETVAEWCITQLREILPNTIDKIQLSFKPETIETSFYHYSHGLKKHNGNCQRIAHGHRSRIEIYRNDQRDEQLEADWSKRWQDIYIGTREDLINNFTLSGNAYYQFRYHSQQGHFELSLPANHCYLIDTDSTVEFIAQHLAETIQVDFPNDKITVKAFEGIGKGALAFSQK